MLFKFEISPPLAHKLSNTPEFALMNVLYPLWAMQLSNKILGQRHAKERLKLYHRKFYG